jgi:hypothetical protein
MVRELADQRQGVVVVDLAKYAASLDPARLDRLRPDGVHWSFSGAVKIAGWLGPQVIEAANREHPPGSPARR